MISNGKENNGGNNNINNGDVEKDEDDANDKIMPVMILMIRQW